MIKTIKNEVAAIQKLANELSDMRYDDPKFDIAEKSFWRMVDDLDRRAVGLVGRHVRFGVADGYAHYIVVKEGKRMVSVEQLPIYDNWHFPGVYEGKIQRGIVERHLEFASALKALFAKKDLTPA